MCLKSATADVLYMGKSYICKGYHTCIHITHFIKFFIFKQLFYPRSPFLYQQSNFTILFTFIKLFHFIFQLLLVLFGIMLSCQWKSNKTSPEKQGLPSDDDRVTPIPKAVKRKRNKNTNF